MTIRQAVRIYTATLEKGKSLTLSLGFPQGGWLQLIDGALTLEPGKVTMAPGDGCAIEKESNLAATATANSEFLWFVFD